MPHHNKHHKHDCRDKPCHDKPCHDKPCHDKPCHDKPCHDKPCHDKPCHDKPCHDKPCKPHYKREGRIRIIHNIAAVDGFPVNVLLDGELIAEDVPYKTVTDYIDLKRGKHELLLQQDTQTPISKKFYVCPEQDYSLVASGALENQEEYPLEILCYHEKNYCDCECKCTKLVCNARVKFTHGSPGAPAVDVLVDDAVVFANVSYGEDTDFVALRAGTYNVKVNVAGTTTTVFEADLEFEAKINYNVIATGILGGEPTLSALLATAECTP